ncbi:MAG: hypothetical protein BGO11_17155 [Solirubrobacterales bacterium 70-9]|nr:MAG: hypothetical protein BGO11_17155 [Solirubrobacterales bacterium 70-9]
MHHFIAWCGFLGAWLLVAGPLDQAVREIEETGFEHERLEEAVEQVEEPAPVSNWWLLVPPVWWLLRRKRESIYRHLVGEALADEDLLAFLTVKDILNAWLYVAAGASLIAVKETWELHEAYEWPEWVFWLGAVGMLTFCIAITVGRTLRRHRRPAVEG